MIIEVESQSVKYGYPPRVHLSREDYGADTTWTDVVAIYGETHGEALELGLNHAVFVYVDETGADVYATIRPSGISPHPYPPVYALITLSQFSPILEDCQDGEESIDWLYHQHLNEKLNPLDRKSTRLNSSHIQKSRMPSSA